MIEIPLFPLNTVLYPGGPLPLRIFEPRYLAMISRCLRRTEGFGVVLIKAGSETDADEMFSVGTVAEIVDWDQGSDGLLGVTTEGRERFQISTIDRQSDGLYIGQVELLEREPASVVPEEYQALAALLPNILDDLGGRYRNIHREYEDASWVGFRFAEILSLPVVTKQAMLELMDPEARLSMLRPHVDASPDRLAPVVI